MEELRKATVSGVVGPGLLAPGAQVRELKRRLAKPRSTRFAHGARPFVLDRRAYRLATTKQVASRTRSMTESSGSSSVN